MAFSLLDARTKFGGATPDSLNEYYRGGALVPDVVGTAGVPASGTITLAQLRDAYITDSATAILSHVWTNRSTYFRKAKSDNTWMWSGDVYDRANSPVNRYITSYTIAGNPAPTAPNYSGYTTVIGLASGSSSTISALTTNLGGTAVDNSSGNEMYWRVIHVEGRPTDITSVTMTATRSGGNSGSWNKILVLPGKWRLDTTATTSNMAMGWSRSLASGRVGWFATGSGYDGNMTPPAAGTTGNIIRGSEWWYNNSVSYVQMNPSASATTFKVGNVTDSYGSPAGVWVYNRRYVEFYLVE